MTTYLQRLRILAPMVGIAMAFAASASGQGRVGPPGSVHRLHSTLMPPGAIAQEQLLRDASFRGYFQPVELHGPEGSSISLVIDGKFQKSQPSPVRVGLLIGKVYRFRVTGIKRNQGFEVFPTVEVINRLYPPKGQATRFPIPVQLTEDELAIAISGRFVTRVIYLENPKTALPLQQDGKQQRYYEIAPDQDPVQVADDLGRPMAILRMGSRTPAFNESIVDFSYGSPPMLVFPRLNEPEEIKAPRQARRPLPNRTNAAATIDADRFNLAPEAPRSPSVSRDFVPRGESRSR